jgi:hypothetical protein
VADQHDAPVTAPDQHKPTNLKWARIGGVGSIAVLLLMLLGNHEGQIENLFVIGTAALIAAVLVGDAVLRRNGLRR